MTTTMHPLETVATPTVFSHVAPDQPAPRTASSDRARPVRFSAPADRPRR
jgi:hypothetical protein